MKFFLRTYCIWLTAGAWLMTANAGAQMPAGPVPGFGQNKPPIERVLGVGGSLGQWWNSPHVIEKLNLTEEQRKAMDAVLLEHRKKLIDLRGNVQKGELDLEPLMKADPPDEKKLLAQIDTVAQARAELEKANARFLLALRTKITPEQWKQLQQLREEQRRLHEGWNRPELHEEHAPHAFRGESDGHDRNPQ